MQKIPAIIAACACVLSLTMCKQGPTTTADYNVVPQPSLIVENSSMKPFELTSKTTIGYPEDNAELKTQADMLADYIFEQTGIRPNVTAGKGQIMLTADLEAENPEAYVLTVDADGVTVNGATVAGTFYGVQTLRNSIPALDAAKVILPAAEIRDEPRFGYRGAHLDVCRHFFPADSVKKFIDMMAMHKLNKFHFHITEDQGWRWEVKSHPELTTIGSHRDGTVIGRNTEEYDSIPVDGFYTQDELRDLVKYAADRQITIIPEIDLPGHMQAALAAYPELGCTGGPYEVWKRWGVSKDVLCAGNDSTYKFLDDVFTELVDIFPSEIIHIGGDECPKDRWKECAKCQAKARELGLKTDASGTREAKLQNYVMAYVSNLLREKGRRVIGWDEILDADFDDNAIIMSWRGEEGGIAGATRGHDVVMTPNQYLYFDYYQTTDKENEPLAIGGYVPLETVYTYEPVPAVLTDDQKDHIIGVQANVWTEYMPTFEQVQYMTLPRMAALSEIQWTDGQNKDYENFKLRLLPMLQHYDRLGYIYSTRAFDDADQQAAPAPAPAE